MTTAEIEKYITEYFKGQSGKFIDIGSKDPIKDCYTRQLIKNGFTGAYIQPSPHYFKQFLLEHFRNTDINLFGFAVSQSDGELEILETEGILAGQKVNVASMAITRFFNIYGAGCTFLNIANINIPTDKLHGWLPVNILESLQIICLPYTDELVDKLRGYGFINEKLINSNTIILSK